MVMVSTTDEHWERGKAMSLLSTPQRYCCCFALRVDHVVVNCRLDVLAHCFLWWHLHCISLCRHISFSDVLSHQTQLHSHCCFNTSTHLTLCKDLASAADAFQCTHTALTRGTCWLSSVVVHQVVFELEQMKLRHWDTLISSQKEIDLGKSAAISLTFVVLRKTVKMRRMKDVCCTVEEREWPTSHQSSTLVTQCTNALIEQAAAHQQFTCLYHDERGGGEGRRTTSQGHFSFLIDDCC